MNKTVKFVTQILKFYYEWWKMLYPYWFLVSVLVFLILFVGWKTFIFRLYRYFYYYLDFPVRCVDSPFTMHLDRQNITFPGVRCMFSSRKLCYVLPFWGVPAKDFYDMMRMDWLSMKNTLFENGPNSFTNKCLFADSHIRLNAEEQISVDVSPPPSVYNDERMDQALLPLVIVLFMEEIIENIDESLVFAEAFIIKVPAILMSIQSRRAQREPDFPVSRIPEVIASYATEFNPHTPVVLKRTFDGYFTENINNVNIPVCLACCHRVVDTATFPCLHTSLCSICYRHCDVCPSCSGPIFYCINLDPLREIPRI